MAGALAIPERKLARVPALAMAKRFGRYRPMEEKRVRKIEIVEDETLRQLKEAWKKLKPGRAELNYWDAFTSLKKLHYSASDVEAFPIVLAEFQEERDFGEKAGSFLSALMNNCNDRDYVINTGHLVAPISYLGYHNTKHIIVEGEGGNSCGQGMGDGSITVNGNAGHATGIFMNTGSIIINGNVGHSLGAYMKGGTIIVNGNADYAVGDEMKGGEIHIFGEIGSIAKNIVHGKIYHKGKLIVDK